MAFGLRSAVKFNLLFNNTAKRGLKMSAMLRAEKLLEEMKEKNPYYEKYAQKIASLQQTSPEEFIQRIEEKSKEAKVKKEASKRNYTELLRPKEGLAGASGEIPHKKLSDIMKMELLEGKSDTDIQEIWLEYHKTKDVIAAVIPTEQYEMLIKRGKEYPLFLFALPRSEGYEFIMLQFAANTVHFTPLLCYQVHKENAPECLNLVHYTEFKDKGIVLMRGEYDSTVLNGAEASCLANQLQLYYCNSDDSKLELLEKFTKQPDSFKHMDLIKELEDIKLQ